MASTDRLSCLKKRDLLNQPVVSLETLTRWGERYEAMESYQDAVEFYGKANAVDALERLREKAVEDCDVFLFKRICRLLDLSVSNAEWIDLARRAEACGKYRFAADAYRQGNDEESAVRLLAIVASGPMDAPSSKQEKDDVA